MQLQWQWYKREARGRTWASGLFDFIGLGWHVLYEDHYQNEP